jgi:hypothetical protein
MSELGVFADMLGVVMTTVSGAEGGDEMVFTAQDGRRFRFYHRSDCCETVDIQDICGDLSWLVGYPISEAAEISSDDADAPEWAHDSYTWTFYRFSTVRGTVTVRWLGESNGYYSESVDYEVLEAP